MIAQATLAARARRWILAAGVAQALDVGGALSGAQGVRGADAQAALAPDQGVELILATRVLGALDLGVARRVAVGVHHRAFTLVAVLAHPLAGHLLAARRGGERRGQETKSAQDQEASLFHNRHLSSDGLSSGGARARHELAGRSAHGR